LLTQRGRLASGVGLAAPHLLKTLRTKRAIESGS
jgi:hypothetical protein